MLCELRSTKAASKIMIQSTPQQLEAMNELIAAQKVQLKSGDYYFSRLDVRCVSIKYNDEDRPVVTYEVNTAPWMMNTYGNTHGGAIASFIDIVTSFAIAADLKYWDETRTEMDIAKCVSDFGVSRRLSCQYMQALPIDKVVILEATVDSNTKRNTLITAKVVSQDHKTVYISGTHDKVKLTAQI